jgi:hypothetical protein
LSSGRGDSIQVWRGFARCRVLLTELHLPVADQLLKTSAVNLMNELLIMNRNACQPFWWFANESRKV